MRKLRVLHTSDWHLGQKLANLSRDAEQEAALNWLISVIESEKVDVLLVSGDIFDTVTPTVAAEAMYYRFLARLIPTCCRHVVITGGNHDSPAKLNAPKPLMDALKIHVVGQVSAVAEEEVFVFYDAKTEPELVVAAVPFIREQNLTLTEVGQTIEARRGFIRAAIKSHFDLVGAEAARLQFKDVVHICMGHLCIGGEDITEEQNRVYLGDTHTLAASDFHEVFDYVALGHIHRAQKLNKTGSVRYSGSLIPLSFSELGQKKLVWIVDFEQGALASVRDVEVPVTRKLVRIKTTLENLLPELSKHASVDPAYPTWAEVVVESENPVPQLHQTLMQATEQLAIEVLKHSNVTTAVKQNHARELEQISQLRVSDVFRRKAEQMGYSEDELKQMMADFEELHAWRDEKMSGE
jgi:DNA repair protein SbcD/Mre11